MKSRPRRALSLTFALCLLTCAGLTAQTFRARIDTVQVTVTVTDANGRLITGLSRDDFEIFEDGVEQRIAIFTDQRVPVSLGVLLDASDSMRGQRIVDARDAVDRFVAAHLIDDDEAFVAAFNHAPKLVAPWTQPPALLEGSLKGLIPSGGTALYDSLLASATMFTHRVHPRAALVVISDGQDTASDWTLVRTQEVMRRTDPLVYAIAVDSVGMVARSAVNVEALREITGQSGGYTEVVRETVDIAPATARIATELNSQYTLGYVSSKPPDDQWRAIRVRVKDRNYFTRARRGYFAVRP